MKFYFMISFAARLSTNSTNNLLNNSNNTTLITAIIHLRMSNASPKIMWPLKTTTVTMASPTVAAIRMRWPRATSRAKSKSRANQPISWLAITSVTWPQPVPAARRPNSIPPLTLRIMEPYTNLPVRAHFSFFIIIHKIILLGKTKQKTQR